MVCVSLQIPELNVHKKQMKSASAKTKNCDHHMRVWSQPSPTRHNLWPSISMISIQSYDNIKTASIRLYCTHRVCAFHPIITCSYCLTPNVICLFTSCPLVSCMSGLASQKQLGFVQDDAKKPIKIVKFKILQKVSRCIPDAYVWLINRVTLRTSAKATCRLSCCERFLVEAFRSSLSHIGWQRVITGVDQENTAVLCLKPS